MDLSDAQMGEGNWNARRVSGGKLADPFGSGARLDKIEERLDAIERKLDLTDNTTEPSFVWRPCYNYQAGRYADVDTIVYHYTAGSADAEQIVDYWNTLKSPNRVSAHYIIDRDGKLTRAVKESDTAWHAWKWNPQSIGIEVCAAPEERATSAQYESLAWLTKDIMTRHSIKRITGHRFLGIATKCPGDVFKSQDDIDNWLGMWGIHV